MPHISLGELEVRDLCRLLRHAPGSSLASALKAPHHRSEPQDKNKARRRFRLQSNSRPSRSTALTVSIAL